MTNRIRAYQVVKSYPWTSKPYPEGGIYLDRNEAEHRAVKLGLNNGKAVYDVQEIYIGPKEAANIQDAHNRGVLAGPYSTTEVIREINDRWEEVESDIPD